MNRLSACAAVAMVALFMTSSASSRPASGINVRVAQPLVAMVDYSDLNAVALKITFGAAFSPAALFDNVRVTVTATNPKGCGGPAVGGRSEGNNFHSSALYTGLTGACRGDRLLVVIRWLASSSEDDQGAYGRATKSLFYRVPPAEPARRLSPQEKQSLARTAAAGFGLSAGVAAAGIAVASAFPPLAIVCGVAAAVGVAVFLWQGRMAFDPVDTNFRAIAKPRAPSAPKVAPGEGVSAAAAAAVNRLLALQVKQIGLAEAIYTAFNRSQGAHVKKQTTWEKRQVRAAGTYAAQLSSLMLAEVKLRPTIRRAFTEPIVVTEGQAYEFQDSLVFGGQLPSRLASVVTKLGLTKTDQEEIRAQLAGFDPRLYTGDAAAAFADPQYLSQLRQVAADLKAFARRAAKDPLNTGQ